MAGKWIRQERPQHAAGQEQRGVPGVRGETVLQSADAPVFAALAAQWRSAGRMVPGQADREWTELVARVPHVTPR